VKIPRLPVALNSIALCTLHVLHCAAYDKASGMFSSLRAFGQLKNSLQKGKKLLCNVKKACSFFAALNNPTGSNGDIQEGGSVAQSTGQL